MAPGSEIVGDVEIGDYTRINGPASIRARSGRIRIGRYCAIGRELTVIAQNHESTRANVQWALDKDLGLPHRPVARSVTIGHNAWIGDRVMVLAGAVIGDGAVVAAGSVVSSAGVPSFTVAAGVPARPIRRRFAEDVTAMLGEVAWWDWPRAKVLRNRAFFEVDLTAVAADEARALVV